MEKRNGYKDAWHLMYVCVLMATVVEIVKTAANQDGEKGK